MSRHQGSGVRFLVDPRAKRHDDHREARARPHRWRRREQGQPWRRADRRQRFINGEKFTVPQGLEQGERMEEGRVRIRSYAPRSGSPRGLRQSLCARRTRLRCARRAGCCEEDGPGRWGHPNSRRERCSAADGRGPRVGAWNPGFCASMMELRHWREGPACQRDSDMGRGES